MVTLLVDAGDFRKVGLLFYNAQFVPVDSGAGYRHPINVLEVVPNLTIPRPLWTLAIVVALVGAGYAAAARTVGNPVVSGAAVVVGYLPLMIVGTFVLEGKIYNDLFMYVSFSPETFPAIAAGICFPVVCGMIGGS